MDKKAIKRAMIVVMVVIIIMLITIIIIKSQFKNQENKTFKDQGIGIEINNKIEPVTSDTMFYTVQNILQKYFSYVYLDINAEPEEGQTQTMAEIYRISTEEQKRECIYNLLDVDYIKENNITKSNINEYVKFSTDKVMNCSVIEMNTLSGEEIQSYSVYVELTTKDKEEKEIKQRLYYIVTIDNYATLFMIKPIESNNISIDKIDLTNDRQKIEKNGQNLFSYIRLNEGEIAEKYLNKYKELMLNNAEEAFNKLEENYREKRFGNYNTFEKYINTNRKEIEKLNISKYLTNREEKYTEYVCKDMYDNLFIFDTTSVTNYTVKLDTYTITTEKFKTTYEASDNKGKVMMNVDKWIEMLNNRDYTAAYDVLDETFRNNSFGSEEKFEAYMREKIPLHYKATYSEFTETNNTFVQKISLTDITGEDTDSIEKSIIMQLKEGTDFVMSFEI